MRVARPARGQCQVVPKRNRILIQDHSLRIRIEWCCSAGLPLHSRASAVLLLCSFVHAVCGWLDDRCVLACHFEVVCCFLCCSTCCGSAGRVWSFFTHLRDLLSRNGIQDSYSAAVTGLAVMWWIYDIRQGKNLQGISWLWWELQAFCSLKYKSNLGSSSFLSLIECHHSPVRPE
jgi:hypothetical protein